MRSSCLYSLPLRSETSRMKMPKIPGIQPPHGCDRHFGCEGAGVPVPCGGLITPVPNDSFTYLGKSSQGAFQGFPVLWASTVRAIYRPMASVDQPKVFFCLCVPAIDTPLLSMVNDCVRQFQSFRAQCSIMGAPLPRHGAFRKVSRRFWESRPLLGKEENPPNGMD